MHKHSAVDQGLSNGHRTPEGMVKLPQGVAQMTTQNYSWMIYSVSRKTEPLKNFATTCKPLQN